METREEIFRKLKDIEKSTENCPDGNLKEWLSWLISELREALAVNRSLEAIIGGMSHSKSEMRRLEHMAAFEADER